MTRIETRRDSATCSAGGLRRRALPEALAEIFDFQNVEDQRLVVPEHGDQMTGVIRRVDLRQEDLRTPAIGNKLPRSCRR